MKSLYILFRSGAVLCLGVLASMNLLTSCSGDDDAPASPRFSIESVSDDISISANGISQSKRVPLTVRSNTPWHVAFTSDTDTPWLHIFVDEGCDDGIFYIWADANKAFVTRQGQLVIDNGQGLGLDTIRVSQQADVPRITLDESFTLQPAGGQLKVPVASNVDWTASLSGGDWAQIDSVSSDTIYISAGKNREEHRSATLTVMGTGEYNSLSATATIGQDAAGVFMNEHFDWMQEGIEDFYYNYPEQNISKWTPDELAHGWTTSGVSLTGGRGYIKIGKTNYGGDVLSPKIPEIQGARDVVVTLKVIGYVSKGGKKDDGILKIGIEGPGLIVGETLAPLTVAGHELQMATFNVTIYPNSSKMEHGADYDPWSQPGALITVHVHGFTSESQLHLVGGEAWAGALKGKGQGKNRLLIDDVKIVEE